MKKVSHLVRSRMHNGSTAKSLSGGGIVCGLLACLALGSCAQAPTKVAENPGRVARFSEPVASGERAMMAEPNIVISESTIVIDVRPPFEFTMAHIPRSISMRWEDFAETQDEMRGRLIDDTFALSRRLARAGLAETSSVVVLGSGRFGSGSEGRMAWVLKYLGIEKVQFASFDAVKMAVTTQAGTPLKAMPIWKPNLQTSLRFSLSEMSELIKMLKSLHEKQSSQASSAAKGVGSVDFDGRRTVLVDVSPLPLLRSKDEGRKVEAIRTDDSLAEIPRLQIDWRKCVNERGRPDQRLKDDVMEMGAKLTDRLVVTDAMGVQAASCVLALRQAGFSYATLFDGGWKFLKSQGVVSK